MGVSLLGDGLEDGSLAGVSWRNVRSLEAGMGRRAWMSRQTSGAAFRWSVPVRFGDTDPYGVVYFVSYFRYMKEALDEFLRTRGLPPERTYRDTEEGRGLPIAASSARFV